MQDLEEGEVINVPGYSQQLDHAQGTIVEALGPPFLTETPRLRDKRAKTLVLAEKAQKFKTFRRHRKPLKWPRWLQEEGMEALLQEIYRAWEVRKVGWERTPYGSAINP